MDIRTPLNQCIALIVAGVLFLNPIVSTAAQLTVDAAAQANTHVTQAGNGVPVINIATPNASGLSNNTFRDYNVGREGVILNNATGKVQATQLGGIVVGNPNLKGQAAQVILNQVSGGNRSNLQGYTEVAGQGARVIVANPHGITCNGCGFINTPRATLTTGKPIMDGERLERFQVDGGDITVEGEALNATNVDQFDLITRSAKLNTALHAKQLNVITGRNDVQADTLTATPRAEDGSEKPQLAIDSSALGGMYANTIRLVGTEQGVGVKLAGNLASTTGDIQVDANGKVTLAQTSSAGNLRVTADRAHLTDTTYATGSATVRARDDVQIDGSLAAAQHVVVEGARVDNRGVVEAGVELDNRRNATGDTVLNAQNIRNAGSVVATRRLAVGAGDTLDNRGGRLVGVDSVQASAHQLDNRDGGVIGSDRAAEVTVGGTLDNRYGGKLSAEQLTVRTPQLLNTDGRVMGGDVLLAATAALDNRWGLISARRSLDLNAGDLDNSAGGRIISDGGLTAQVAMLSNRSGGMLSSLNAMSLTSQGLLDNQGGTLVTNAGLSLRAGHFDNRQGGTLSAGGRAELRSASLDNSVKGDIGAGSLLLLTGQLDNHTQGRITSTGQLDATATGLDQHAQGQLVSATGIDLNLQQGLLRNSDGGLLRTPGALLLRQLGVVDNRAGGEVSSDQAFDLSATAVDNRGGRLVSAIDLSVRVATGLDNSLGGVITATRDLILETATLSNAGGGTVASARNLQASVAGQVDNRDRGTFSAGDALRISSGSVLNRGRGLLSGNASVDVTTGLLDNQQGGQLVSQAGMSVVSTALDNRGGIVSSKQTLTLTSGDVNNGADEQQRGGWIHSDTDLTLTAGEVDSSDGGEISAKGELQLRVGALVQRQGRLIGERRLTLDTQGGRLINQGGLISSNGPLTLQRLGLLDNRGGEITSQQSFGVQAERVDNRQGRVLSEGQLTLDAAQLDNSDKGLMSGAQGVSVRGTDLNNSREGTVSSRDGNLDIVLDGTLDNRTQGALASKGDQRIAAAVLDNRKGIVSSEHAITLGAGERLDNGEGGLISALGNLVVDRADTVIDNQGGQLSGQSIRITGQQLNNGNGLIISRQGLDLDLLGALINTQGARLASGADLLLKAGQVDNRGGKLVSQGMLDVQTGSLDNRDAGSLASQQNALLRLTGALLNDNDGLLFSQYGKIDLQAAALDNQGGTLKSQGDVVLRLDRDLNNQGGQLESESGDLDLHAANLDNTRGGLLSAVKGTFKGLFGGLFDNAGGTTQARTIDLRAGTKVGNQGGYLSALGGAQRIVTGSLDNRDGGLYAADVLQLEGGDLLNARGKIGAKRVDFGLSGTLTNALGQLESESDLSLRAAQLDNRGGQLRALGKTGTARVVTTGMLLNDGGVLATANHDLALEVGGLSNRGGQLLHTGTGSFGLTSAQVMQAGGTLYTNGLLSLSADSWTNSSVLQARQLELNIDRFVQTAEGKLLAVERFVGRGNDWTNDGLLASDGTLQLDLSGTYAGNGRVSSLGQLQLAANVVQLDTGASLAGGAETRVSARQRLSNAGRLTALGDLALETVNLENRGTLGSAGILQITAAELLNQRGLLFSGGDMALRINTLRNDYGDLYSLGGLDLAGRNGARAALLENISGSVESAGDMTLAVDTLLNRKDVLTTKRKLVGGNVDVYWDDVCKGKGCEAYFRATEIWEDVVDRDSPSAFVTAGGALRFGGDAFRNHYSSVSAGGDITIDAKVFENKGAGGGEQRNLTASLYTRDRSEYLGFIRAKNQFNEQPGSITLDEVMAASGYPAHSIFDVIDTTTPTVGAVVASAIVQSAGAVNITASQRIDNSVVRVNQAGAGTITARGDAVADPRQAQTQVRALNPQLPPDLAQRQVNPVTLPSFSLPQGDNGLFRISDKRGQNAVSGDALGATGGQTQNGSGTPVTPLAPITAPSGSDGVPGTLTPGLDLVKGVPALYVPSTSHHYLVETNPALTDLKQFLSSDYLLDRLNLRADQSIKRLGDGLYEQRLIRQAVVARTGQRYIDGLASDEALFRYLMDNAIASKDALSLSVGVSLSAEQVAALTHDIVWMERVQVNGETVLAPVLYLAHANGRLTPNGALIQGRDVNLITGGELNNVGTLRAANALSANANTVNNTGLIEAGGRLNLLAADSIRNAQGGIIAGRDVSLTALTGDVINERSVTRLQGRAGNEQVTKDLVDGAARIEAANDLTISAGRDIGNVGGALTAGGDLRLSAGRDLYLVSQEGVDSHEYQRRRVSGHDSSLTQYRSEVTAGGNLAATAGQDLSVVASTVEARGDLTLQAGRDVTLAAVADETHSYAKGKKGQTKYERQADDVSQQAAVVQAGSGLAVDAGRDLRMLASQASAGGEAYLVAGDKLELLAANDNQYSLYDMSKKGSFGSKKTQRDEVTDVKAVGSEVRSGGDLVLAGGGDQLYQGAKLNSGADLLIQSGGGVTFEAVKDLQQESHEKSNTSLAWTSAKGKGNTDETVRQSQLHANGDVLIRAVDGLKVDVSQVNQQTIRQSIDAMVEADPQLAWMKDLEQRGDVDWRQVKELHDSFKYSHSGLGAGAQIVIAIVISYLTAGAASSLVATGASTAGASVGAGSAWAAGSGAALQGIGWANAAVTASAVGLTSNAAISTINNRGNLSLVAKDITSKDALRGYAVAGVTAGLTTGLFDGWTGTQTEGTTAGASSGAAANTTKTLSSGTLASVDGLGRFAGGQLLQNGTSVALDRALGGDSSFSDALRNSLANTFAAAGFNWAGTVSGKDQLNLPDGSVSKTALHALMGGLAAEAAGGDFRIGALAAGVNEAVADRLTTQFSSMTGNERRQLLLVNSQIVGVLTAAAAGGDAKDLQTGSWVAKSATAYNRLLHTQEKKALQEEAAELQKRLGKPGTDVSWEDLLKLAANAQVDQAESARLQRVLQSYSPSNPEGRNFEGNLAIAQSSIDKLAAQDIVLTWSDGSPIVADGSAVKAFQSTERQFTDGDLFNRDLLVRQAERMGSQAIKVQPPAEWKRQFGEQQAEIYASEISQIATNPAEMRELMGRVTEIATGGIGEVTWDAEAILMLAPGGTALRALLARRAALGATEGTAAAVGKEALAGVELSGAKGAGTLANAERGTLTEANFAQNKIRSDRSFSEDGQKIYSELAGTPIKTVDDLASALRAGTIKPNQLPVDYVDLNGTRLILNTRTSTALEQAGIPRNEWFGRNRTGVEAYPGTTFNELASDQLRNNKLPSTGAEKLKSVRP